MTYAEKLLYIYNNINENEQITVKQLLMKLNLPLTLENARAALVMLSFLGPLLANELQAILNKRGEISHEHIR